MLIIQNVYFSDDQTIVIETEEEGYDFNTEWEQRDIKRIITDELKEIQLTMVRQKNIQTKYITLLLLAFLE